MNGFRSSTPSPNPGIRKFNPGTHQSDEQVMEHFVVRTREFDTVLEVLVGNIESPSCQHILMVGPRGRGKTMLLVRVAAQLRTDKALSRRLLPVRFMEESQEIFNMADFWLEALFHLAREIEGQHPDLTRELRETHNDLSSRWREQSLEAQARGSVLAAADRLDRKLVLMVENLQSLCEDVDDDFGWKLRQALQSEHQVMLLASATSRFEGLDDASQPFFELFRSINLQPLATDECRLLWQVVSGDAVGSREIRPLQILTGGNPRLLVIVAEFARRRSLRLLMEELVALIDEHTEYFRGHLEVLAKTERRVYVSVIDLWQPSSAGEIAKRARMDVRIVSTMLGRLVERGALIVEGSGRKRQYAAAERLYSIYYKLRRERDEAAIVENLINFMMAFYDTREISEFSEQLYLEARESPVLRAGLNRALEKMTPADEVDSHAKRKMLKDALDKVAEYYQGKAERRHLVDIIAAYQERDWQKVIDVVNEVFRSRDAQSWQMSEAFIGSVLYCKAEAQEQLGQFQAVVATCEEVVARIGKSTVSCLLRWVSVALILCGRAKRELGDLKGAIEACEEVVERIGKSAVSDLQWLVGQALIEMERTRSEQGDLGGAVAVCEEVVARFGERQKADVRWWVAAALVDKGRAKRELGDPGGAIAAWEEVVRRNGDTEVSGLEWWVAAALVEVGRTKKELGDPVRAMETWEQVVQRYGEKDASDVQWWVALAMIDTARAKKQLGDLEGAIAIWDEVVERYADSEESDLQSRVAEAMIDKGRARKEMGDLEGAFASWEEVVRQYGERDVPSIQRWVITALANKGMRQAEMGNGVEALRVCEEIDRRIEASSQRGETRLEWQVQCLRALSLMANKKKDAALEAFRSAYAKFAPRNRISMHEMLYFVPYLVAAGASERELVAVLSTDPAKSSALAPLIVALRSRQGETVRAPAEVREVAADVRKQIDDRVRSWPDTASISPP